MVTKALHEGNREVFRYFNREIAQARSRVESLVGLSKVEKDPELSSNYRARAEVERKRNAKWAAWQALQFTDPVYREIACSRAMELLKAAYRSRSDVGFKIRHPFISSRLARLKEEMRMCIGELRRPQ